MNDTEWVYGYGRTKHIKDDTGTAGNRYRVHQGEDVGLCGAYGGHPNPKPDRPVCKRCQRIADKGTA